jgi:hypothetical protein
MRISGAAFAFILCSVLVSASVERMKNLDPVIACAANQPTEPQSCAPLYPYSGRTLDSDVVDALPVGRWSDALHRLFQQAKSSAKVSIRITMQAGDEFGFVARVSEGYVIGIRSDLGQEEQESDIAHELYHIVLQQKGYAAQIHTPDGASHYVQEIGYTITSCVDDAIIDEKTSALGFHPELLNRRRYEHLQLPPDVQVRLQDPVYMDGTALLIACDTFRKGNGNRLLTRWALTSAEVARHAEELRNKIGTIRCDDAKACNERKKQIRDILHYPILFCNPLVGKWE